jgi:hypothetical protein
VEESTTLIYSLSIFKFHVHTMGASYTPLDPSFWLDNLHPQSTQLQWHKRSLYAEVVKSCLPAPGADLREQTPVPPVIMKMFSRGLAVMLSSKKCWNSCYRTCGTVNACVGILSPL